MVIAISQYRHVARLVGNLVREKNATGGMARMTNALFSAKYAEFRGGVFWHIVCSLVRKIFWSHAFDGTVVLTAASL